MFFDWQVVWVQQIGVVVEHVYLVVDYIRHKQIILKKLIDVLRTLI